MAVTKILSKNMRIDRLIRYVQNPDKTDDAVFTYFRNCDPKDAAQRWHETKVFYNKTEGIQAFHIIQSFAPGEITPELAHELGIRFIHEHLPEYEVVLGTHVDKGHIHNHIAFNSVNAKTGMKYHSTAESYYQQIRKISDRLCREHGLSVVMETGGKGISYAEWKLHKAGVLTLRELFDQDVEECLSQAMDLGQFYALMEDHGYTVKHHSNYPSFIPDGYTHPYRIKRKGKAWTEDDIERFIDWAMSDATFEAVYGEEVTTGIATRISGDSPNFSASAISIHAEHSVTQDYTIIQHGLIFTREATVGSFEDLFIINPNDSRIKKGTSNNTLLAGTYSVTVSNWFAQNTDGGYYYPQLFARAYVIALDKSGAQVTVYSPIYVIDYQDTAFGGTDVDDPFG